MDVRESTPWMQLLKRKCCRSPFDKKHRRHMVAQMIPPGLNYMCSGAGPLSYHVDDLALHCVVCALLLLRAGCLNVDQRHVLLSATTTPFPGVLSTCTGGVKRPRDVPTHAVPCCMRDTRSVA
eukprot:TRINITY_DN2358_c0_g1_i1.p1 TRINITY_DN2358_c0_g1~~TRINITY_DN2358_c0_g1_i1.p1  ORF type:complete len:123 (-),score=17.65 TRINITY_DN2358_c0_g1_i1:272-640(-)